MGRMLSILSVPDGDKESSSIGVFEDFARRVSRPLGFYILSFSTPTLSKVVEIHSIC
jgi:hypothetical protein